MAESDWNYSGDVNLRHGGVYWRETGSEDTVQYVRVERLADAGGPDNLFRVCYGSLHVTEDPQVRASSLSLVGAESENASREELVLALDAYGGTLRDDDEARVVRVGLPDETWSGRGDFPEPDCVLRSNQSLRKWVEREYLHAPEPGLSPCA